MAGHGRSTAQPCQEDRCTPCLRIFEAKPAQRLGMVLVLAESRRGRRLSADNARARLFGYAGVSCGLCGGGGVITYCFHCFYFAFLLSVDSVVDSVDMVSDIVSSASTIPGSIINSSLLRLLILFLHVQWDANITWRTWNATAKIKVLFDVCGWQFCEALRIKK